jgi:RsiW-degrading membrane proteinase PrsW (M82 family)
MKRRYLSPDEEPALRGEPQSRDPAEDKVPLQAAAREEIDAIRDAVGNEPHLAMDVEGRRASLVYLDWLEEKRRDTTLAGTLAVTLAAALVGGPFAIGGAFMAGRPGLAGAFYIILFGPIVEELLKQSGMIYLLERKPYRIVSSLQFACSAALSALIFATFENLLYLQVFTAGADIDREALARFRWPVCTALHMCCAVIASLGLTRVWRKVLAEGKPADLSYAFPLFAIAIGVHGFYNLFAMLFSDIF